MAGAYIHGLAGREAAAQFGEGAVASDVLARLPAAMNKMSGLAG